MLYFSELFGEKVFTEKKTYVGKVKDFLFLPVATPLITKLIVTFHGKEILVPIKHVHKNGIGFVIDTNYTQSVKSEEEVSLLNNLQNQQIIDIDGVKIIRVNDVIISDAPEFVVSGIDIGALGVFRWIGAAKIVATILSRFGATYKSEFIPWSDIQPEGVGKKRIVLKKELEKLKKIHPEDLAEHLEQATIRNVIKALHVMDKDTSARVIADLNLDYQKEILGRYSAEHAGQILSLIDPDESVDALLVLEKAKREEILPFIEKNKRKQIEFLLHHAKTPIGHLMTTDYLSLPADITIKTAIEKIKNQTAEFSELMYVYAVNKDTQIVGVLNLHELLLQKVDSPLFKVMNQNLILSRLTTPKEIVLRRMLKYHIYAMPIVDENRVLLGIVSLQDISEDIVEEKIK
jgi:magnesium transporter